MYVASWIISLNIAAWLLYPAFFYGYNDADWECEVDEHRSILQNVFLLSTRAISWCSSRQRFAALPSTEAVYMAMANVASEAILLYHLLHVIHRTNSLATATFIKCDNQSALASVDITKFHSHTKHILIRHRFIQQLTAQQKVRFDYCSINAMHVDLFTKPLSGPKFASHLPLIGVLGGEPVLHSNLINRSY